MNYKTTVPISRVLYLVSQCKSELCQEANLAFEIIESTVESNQGNMWSIDLVTSEVSPTFSPMCVSKQWSYYLQSLSYLEKIEEVLQGVSTISEAVVFDAQSMEHFLDYAEDCQSLLDVIFMLISGAESWMNEAQEMSELIQVEWKQIFLTALKHG